MHTDSPPLPYSQTSHSASLCEIVFAVCVCMTLQMSLIVKPCDMLAVSLVLLYFAFVLYFMYLSLIPTVLDEYTKEENCHREGNGNGQVNWDLQVSHLGDGGQGLQLLAAARGKPAALAGGGGGSSVPCSVPRRRDLMPSFFLIYSPMSWSTFASWGQINGTELIPTLTYLPVLECWFVPGPDLTTDTDPGVFLLGWTYKPSLTITCPLDLEKPWEKVECDPYSNFFFFTCGLFIYLFFFLSVPFIPSVWISW